MGLCVSNHVLTNQGLIPAGELQPGQDVWTHEGWKPVTAVVPGVKKSTLKISTQLGPVIQVTPEQRMARKDKPFKFIQARSLETGNSVCILPGENPVLKPAESQKVTKWKLGEKIQVNGPFSSDMAFLIAFYHAAGERVDGKVTFTLSHNIGGLVFTFQAALDRELFEGYEFQNLPDGSYRFTILDPTFLLWLEANELTDASRIPEFLFRSPSNVVSAFTLGHIFGTQQILKDYGFNWSRFEHPEVWQQLWLREGVLAHLEKGCLMLETQRSKDEFDRWIQKAGIYKHVAPVWTEERFEMFYETQITDIQEAATSETVELETEAAGVQMEGLYVGV